MTESRNPPGTLPRRRARLALALGPDRLVAVRLGRWPARPHVLSVLECEMEGPVPGGGWPALADALRELRAALGVGGGTVDVALLRGLAHARVVALPPVRRGELSALVRRSARRHFPVRDEALVADARRVGSAGSGALAPTLAVCSPEAVVEAVAEAAREAGFRLGRIVPGVVALGEAARALVPGARRGRVAVAARTAGRVELVVLRNGTPERIHPLAAGAGEDAAGLAVRVAAAVRDAEGTGLSIDGVVVCGAGAEDVALRHALAQGSVDAPPPVHAPTVQGLPAEAVIALGAALARDGVPTLLPASLLRARARLAARRNAVLLAWTAFFLAVSAALHLHGIRREAEAVALRRREIAADVRRVQEARRGVEGLRAVLVTIAALERGAPSWTGEMAALARALPDSAHLLRLAADSAGWRMNGIARSASAVVPALEASPHFARVALAAPVKWEAGDAGERFEVAAAVESAAASPGRNR